MRSLIGFDVSSKAVHYAVISNGTVLDAGEIKSRTHLVEILAEYNVGTAYIEAIPYVRNFQTVCTLNRAVGRVEELLDISGVRFVRLVSVAEWKKLSVGAGNATKPAVKKKIIEKTGLSASHPQDVYDATGVALAGRILENRKSSGSGK